MPEIRTFRAPSLEAALRIVRDEFGQHAVVLQTRELSRKRLLPWLAPIREVEVTAGRGTGKWTNANSAASDEAEAPRAAEDPGITWSGTIASDGLALDSEEFAPPVAPEAIEPAPPESPPESMSAIESRLASIQRALESLGPGRFLPPAGDAPLELFDLYTELIDADVSEEFARELLQQLKRKIDAEALRCPEKSRAVLAAMVESQLHCGAPIQTVPQRRKVVALVGPTGVGKTTTLAKLAANFRLRDGVRMGLVTVDTYRIAAVEQLRTYAEIIDLPMQVVTSPAEMRRALDELQGLDLVLIDTAGRSPRDELKIQELKRLLDEAGVDEVHLVLSLTSGLNHLISTVRNFRPARISSLILTKLDEAESLGNVLSLSREVDLPISYLTTGQDVPDDIEPAVAARLSRLILGRESLR